MHDKINRLDELAIWLDGILATGIGVYDLPVEERRCDDINIEDGWDVVLEYFFILGLLQKDPEDWFKGGASSDDQAEFDAIAKRREVARAAKDWAAADAARDEATAKGIVLEDGPDGTTWRKA